ncbi:LacI family transcriptional regulator [Agrococcus sediminis]|uniref:LacI family transcriptional regulator n=1 Tax=Agrococcus sediminis TaxID=2599924 RepID=A0A5M8Q8P6_9MICO|nr:LacI family DNA-binding transcriptional regulator [Agrococcus sediminis]KAA6431236.1 LacI family transcriptional regulator [Agrococcus sediminis]
MAGTPTIASVADRAGVSIATASRALHGHGASPRTAERVRSAAAELGYRPNAVARALQSGRTGQIAMIVPDAANPVYARMTSAVQHELAADDRQLLVTQAVEPAAVAAAIARFGPSTIDGLIVVPLRPEQQVLEALERSAVPTVVIGSLPEGAAQGAVRADSRAGVRLAIDHLVSQGARRIAFVNGPVDTTPGRQRLEGYRRAIEDAGLEQDASLVVAAADFTHAAALPAVDELLDRGVDFDALVGANDLIAFAALRALSVRGRAVPGDCLVVGMDDTELAQIAIPSLTSVDLGAEARGTLAAEQLLASLRGDADAIAGAVVAPRLVVRESSTGMEPR